MTDNFMRNFVAAVATIICFIIFFVGYMGGTKGWWWLSITMFAVFFIFHKLIKA